MNKRLHPHTISLLNQFIRKPGKSFLSRYLNMQREEGRMPAGEALIGLFNNYLGNNHSAQEIEPIRELYTTLTKYVSIEFKNLYQFAAFVLIADSQSQLDNIDQIDIYLKKLNPKFINFVSSLDGKKFDPVEFLFMNGGINISDLFEYAPDYILRSEKLLDFLVDKIFSFDEKTKIVRYFVDEPIDKIPEKILVRFFDHDQIRKLDEACPGHPAISFWIKHAVINGYLQKKKLYNNETFLNYLPESEREDKELVLQFVTNNGFELEYASLTLKKDTDIVYAAIKQNGKAIQFADPIFLLDHELVLEAIKSRPKVLLHLDYTNFDYSTYGDFLRYALLSDNNIIQEVPHDILNKYPAIINELIELNPYILEFAPISNKSSKEIASKILSREPLVLEYFDISIQSDIELVNIAVKSNGLALKFASRELRANEFLIETALAENKKSYVFAEKILPNRETLLRWIEMQPLIVLHLGLINNRLFDTEMQKLYIIGIIGLYNIDLEEPDFPTSSLLNLSYDEGELPF